MDQQRKHLTNKLGKINRTAKEQETEQNQWAVMNTTAEGYESEDILKHYTLSYLYSGVLHNKKLSCKKNYLVTSQFLTRQCTKVGNVYL